MFDVLALAAPLYILIATGFVIVRTGYFPSAYLPGLSQFVLKLCVPVLIFMAVSRPGNLATLNWSFLLGYAGASLAVAGLVAAAMIWGFRRAPGQALIFGMGSSCSNSIFLGLPLSTILLGEQATTLFAAIMIAENLIVIPLLVALADSAKAGAVGFVGSLRAVLMSFLTSPLMVGLGLGLVVSALGVYLPAALDSALVSVRAAAPVLSLFLVGAFLASERLQGMGGEVTTIATAKLVLHPSAVLAVLWLLPGVPPEMLIGGVIFASVPMFGLFTVFADKHGVQAVASGALVVSTLAGAVTCTLVLMLAGSLL